MIDESSTLKDICYAVAEALDGIDSDVVLTGGSAAEIYAPGAYASLDADFVFKKTPQKNALEDTLARIGFVRSASSGMFVHTKTKYTLDFPRGPLAVGGDYVSVTQRLKRGEIVLQILTPTDCVRDRLAHFYFWDDYTALAAAVSVTQLQRDDVDQDVITKWTEREGSKNSADYTHKLDEYRKRCGLSAIALLDRQDTSDIDGAPFPASPYPMLSSDRITNDQFFYLRLEPDVLGEISLITRSLQKQIEDVTQSILDGPLIPITKADGVLFMYHGDGSNEQSETQKWRARCYINKDGQFELRAPRNDDAPLKDQALDFLATGYALASRLLPLLRASGRLRGNFVYKLVLARDDVFALAPEADYPLHIDLGRQSFAAFAPPLLLYLQRLGGRSGELSDFEEAARQAWERVSSKT
ncbi:MAG: hypothetical protein ABSE64_01075 [Vulcanimicrobiaceae bacterium]